MKIPASQIAQLIGGTIEGNPDVLVSKPAKIEDGGEETITFFANPKYEEYVYSTRASVILVSNDFQPKQTINATLIRVENVRKAIAFLLEQFGQQATQKAEISPQAAIAQGVQIADNVAVGAFTIIQEGANIGAGAVIFPQVFVGQNVSIGKNVTLHPGVRIYADCVIGDNCIIHANTVIGSDGFGFAPQEDGTYKKVPQVGNVVIENDVEIGANTVIDCAIMGSTIVKSGAKLDNLIQIAHNVQIGENTVIAAQAGIAGSTKIGKNVMIGGQAGFVGHIEVADGAKIQAQSGIAASIKQEGKAVYGSPAIPYSDYLRAYAVFKRLPDLYKDVRKLKQQYKP